MDEVARAAGVSRQGLYLQFANKEDLFLRTLQHSLNSRLLAAEAAISRPEANLEIRLVGACDAWYGQFVGSLESGAADQPHATGHGLKHRSASRDEFLKGMTITARMFCAPLDQSG